MERRVVITGMGIWSCLGTSLDEVKQSLYDGKSGIIFSQERKDAGFRSALCANVPKADLKPYLNRNLRQLMPEEAEYAYMATIQAMEHAGLTQDYIDAHEVGVIYGNDSVAEATMRALDKFRQFGATAACGSGAIFQSMNSTVTMNLATLFHLKGINLTTSAACASGSHSLGLGYLLIKNGLQDCIICGGAQEANMFSVASFDGLMAFSVREDEPTKACRPFDKDRDGLIPGGGAATLVVESYEHAKARGAKILKDAGVDLREIGYINAHATSTHAGDGREAMAIAQIFGDYKVPVTSTKSQTGHEMWMAGASEIIYSMLMMKNDFIGGSLNFEAPDEETACINVLPETKETHFDMFLSNSFGFGGTNSTLIVKDWKE